MFRRILREPLAHFAAIGVFLFVLFDVVGGDLGGDRDADGRVIEVDDAVVAELVQRHTAVWQRPPTPQELSGLVEGWVRDEIAYREGVALGLDRDDSVIRRRVQQKMDVLAEESQGAQAATDAELDAWLKANPERYTAPALLSFDQAMVDVQGNATQLDAALAQAKARLDAGAAAEDVSVARLLPTEMRDTPADLVARQFGAEFTSALMALPLDTWQGPVRSGFGLHWVKVTARTQSGVPSLDAVRTAVARDVESERRAKATEAFYRALRAKFDVRMTVDVAKVLPAE